MLELVEYTALQLIKIIVVLVPLLLSVAYLTYAERKVIGYMQCRVGPNRVGFKGLLQPIADAVKLMFKEIVIPTKSNHYLFAIAPIFSFAPVLAIWVIMPVYKDWSIANIDAGVLFIFAMSSLSVYGVLISGWASNSKYALLGALRAAAQTISYEIAMGFALVGVLMAARSMNLQKIVLAQSGNFLHWYFIPLLPLCLVFWIAGIAETNRAPFDLAEGESEIVAGFHVEYSGIAFAVFFLAEYMAMIVIAALLTLFFFGGWMSPFQDIPLLGAATSFVPGIVWFLGKVGFFLFMYLWLRATLPRYRYDQLMRLGWKVLIPTTIVWIFVLGFMIKLQLAPWFNT